MIEGIVLYETAMFIYKCTDPQKLDNLFKLRIEFCIVQSSVLLVWKQSIVFSGLEFGVKEKTNKVKNVCLWDRDIWLLAVFNG